MACVPVPELAHPGQPDHTPLDVPYPAVSASVIAVSLEWLPVCSPVLPGWVTASLGTGIMPCPTVTFQESAGTLVEAQQVLTVDSGRWWCFLEPSPKGNKRSPSPFLEELGYRHGGC